MHVKVCGVRSVEDALACVDAGVSAIGLNFWPGSSRFITVDVARAIREQVPDHVRLVGVFVDAGPPKIRRVRSETGIAWAQLHGHESQEELGSLQPKAYKALRVGHESVLEEARSYPGAVLLLDAAVPGAVGGTGRTFDWTLAEEVARERPVLLAGGLTPANVAEAIECVRPWGVDVASGVESAPGVKDAALVRAFVREAQRHPE